MRNQVYEDDSFLRDYIKVRRVKLYSIVWLRPRRPRSIGIGSGYAMTCYHTTGSINPTRQDGIRESLFKNRECSRTKNPVNSPNVSEMPETLP